MITRASTTRPSRRSFSRHVLTYSRGSYSRGLRSWVTSSGRRTPRRRAWPVKGLGRRNSCDYPHRNWKACSERFGEDGRTVGHAYFFSASQYQRLYCAIHRSSFPQVGQGFSAAAAGAAAATGAAGAAAGLAATATGAALVAGEAKSAFGAVASCSQYQWETQTSSRPQVGHGCSTVAEATGLAPTILGAGSGE